MRKYSSAKNLLDQRRIQKKSGKPLNKEFLGKQKSQERRRNSFNELRNELKKIKSNLVEHDEKTRLYIIENNTNKLIKDFGGMKADISDIKKNIGKMSDNIGKMSDTMDTILLISLSKDTSCPYNQRMKINNMLKKKRENIIRKYTNTNPNNANNNQINANIPINTTPARKLKIKTQSKNDNPVLDNKYQLRKYGASININNKSNSSKISINKKPNIAYSSRDEFSSKKSDSKYSNNKSIKLKNDSIFNINGRISFNYLKNKERRNKDFVNPFRKDLNKKKDKKKKKYAKVSNIYKTSINK